MAKNGSFLGLKLLKIIKISKNIPSLKVPHIEHPVALCCGTIYPFAPHDHSLFMCHQTAKIATEYPNLPWLKCVFYNNVFFLLSRFWFGKMKCMTKIIINSIYIFFGLW